MGNSAPTSAANPPLVSRPYEEAIKDITERLPTTVIVSYGRVREPVPCGRVSNWVTYRIPSSTSDKALYVPRGEDARHATDSKLCDSSKPSLNVQCPLDSQEVPSSLRSNLNEGERARMARCCFASATDFTILQEKQLGRPTAESATGLFATTTVLTASPTVLGHVALSPSKPEDSQNCRRSAPPACDEYGDMHSTLATHTCYTGEGQTGCAVETSTTTSSSVAPETDPLTFQGQDDINTRTCKDTTQHKRQCPQNPAPFLTPSSSCLPIGATHIPIYGHQGNHKPFLEPDMLDYFLPFVLDGSLSSCLCVCPHWFVSIYKYLQQRVSPIVEAFKATYSGKELDFESTTFSIQPLFTAVNAVVRIDLLIYCKVLPRCVKHCTEFGYSFSYLPPPSSDMFPTSHQRNKNKIANEGQTKAAVSGADDSAAHFSANSAKADCDSNREPFDNLLSEVDPLRSTRLLTCNDAAAENDDSALGGWLSSSPLRSTGDHCTGFSSTHIVLPPQTSSYAPGGRRQREYQAQFRFETLKKGSRRVVWVHRDMCRFHGDELMVASLANVPTVNVDDRLEIPVNISNAFGLVDLNSITWKSADFVTTPAYREFGQLCEIVRPHQQWVGLDAFQPTTSERLQVNDHFGPQWKHVRTEFTGIDITCSRSTYIASATGEVPQSRRWLGIESIVKPAGTPIVCPLTRLGLQHDRFSRQHVRQGDTILLFITQGGGILQ